MKIYYCSDLHNEFKGENYLLNHSGDLNAILVVAGDINVKGRSLRDIEEIADRWKAVICVPGNHDWWKLALHEKHKFVSDKPNVYFLLNEVIEIDEITFCGTTLWFPLDNPLDSLVWEQTMNDKKRIRGYGYKRLKSIDIHKEYLVSVKFIKDCIENYTDNKKILITHHAPSERSISECYYGQTTNKFYASNLDHLVAEFDYAIHGHTHQEFDYFIDQCNVVCNPKGYGNENPNFKIKSINVEE